ncbi:hypothetical protein KA111_02190 [Candidatus Woesebacteria bacterium]|nr:hypothetical protein [Candidatus Woesebacteria bacterium]
MIRLKVTPVVGLPQFTGWSQVAESTSSLSTRLISVFAISGKHAGNVGRDVSDKISDYYFSDIEQLHQFIQELILFVDENECELFIACAIVSGGKSIFVTKGGSVFLKRGEKAGKILSSENQIKIIKGNYTENDVFVLTTYQASQFLNEIEQKFLQGFDVDIIITSIVPGLHAQADSSLSAIVFINQEIRAVESSEELANYAQGIDSESSSGDQTFSRSSLEIENLDENHESIEATIDIEDDDENKIEAKIEFISDVKTATTNKPNYFFSFFGKFFQSFKKILEIVFLITVKSFKKLLHLVKSFDVKNFSINFGSFSNKLNKKLIFIAILIIFIVVFALSIFIKNKQETERINGLINPYLEKIAIAKEQKDTDPIASRDTVREVINSLNVLQKENSKSSAIKLIDNQLKDLSNFYNDISGKEELSDLDTFYDLRLIQSDYIANDVDVIGDQLAMIDSEKKQVVVLDVNTKKVYVKSFSEYDNVKDLSINAGKVFVLADGVKSFELKEDSQIEEVKELGDSNRDASLINTYDRFVYILNPEKRDVYRYSIGEDGYSDPVGWMKSATGLKYDEITSFSVDGDIWFSTIDGQIKKFSAGKEDRYEIRGLTEAFSKRIEVYTNADLENIYVLEADENRIVILSKSGEFKKEIKSSSLSTVGSFAVNEKLNKIFAVSGSIIFEIPISL